MNKIIFNKPCNSRSTARATAKQFESLNSNYIKATVIDNGNGKTSFDRWGVGLVLLTETLKLTCSPRSRNKFDLVQLKHNGRDQRAYNQSKKLEKHIVSVIVKPSRSFA